MSEEFETATITRQPLHLRLSSPGAGEKHDYRNIIVYEEIRY